MNTQQTINDVLTDKDQNYKYGFVTSIETEKDMSHINKPQRKMFSSINIKPKKVVKEFRVDNDNILEVGTKLDVNHFKVDQFVDASSISVGKDNNVFD